MTEGRHPGPPAQWSSAAWANRIVGYQPQYPTDQLMAHPMNPWLHNAKQQEALYAVMAQVGWWDAVKVSESSGYVVDGHLRVMLALRHHQPTVPVLFVRMTPAEEQVAVATANHIARMAAVDPGSLDTLLSEISETGILDGGALLNDVLGELQASLGQMPLPPPPEPIGLGLLPVPGPGGSAIVLVDTDPERPIERAERALQPSLGLEAPTRESLATLAGHRAAIPRKEVSRPMQWYADQGLLLDPVLDYGCGMDPHLHARFDPAYAPDYRVFKQTWKTVTLNYVLNVIPLEHNRIEALMTARCLNANGTYEGGYVLVSIWDRKGPEAISHRGYQASWNHDQWERCLFKVFTKVDRLDPPGFWAWRCHA